MSTDNQEWRRLRIAQIKSKLVEQSNGCLMWPGTLVKGYGQVKICCKSVYVHRLLYEDANGPIPSGMVIDHLCRNPACSNVEHLEVVTIQENLARGLYGRLRTQCKRGHVYTEATSYVSRDGVRFCRLCRRERQAKWDREHKKPCQHPDEEQPSSPLPRWPRRKGSTPRPSATPSAGVSSLPSRSGRPG